MCYPSHLASVLSLLVALANTQTPLYLGALRIDPGLNADMLANLYYPNCALAIHHPALHRLARAAMDLTSGSVKLFVDTKCLDVTGGSTTNGNQLQIWTCSTNNNPNQQLPFTVGRRLPLWTNYGKCVDLTDGSLANGDRPQLEDCSGTNANQVRKVGYSANALPATSENGQSGTNACGSGQSQTSKCQTAWIKYVLAGLDWTPYLPVFPSCLSPACATDFCLWAPPLVGTIGDTERDKVVWCTKAGHGTRTIPNGTLKGVHFVTTPDYVQVTGKGDFTKINVKAGDDYIITTILSTSSLVPTRLARRYGLALIGLCTHNMSHSSNTRSYRTKSPRCAARI
ncbi:hypothetical protein B0H16DRAFT_1795251 [Mycena metata]|uniref:Ricin B lectin domain-containing protein n=1 Tax=Mycena metata TaxID=1033252 RepID=A0AAD7HGT8_9AGAR|nr:hypothetical protein B0H16DRAFT_1795251 [Mycena metata]